MSKKDFEAFARLFAGELAVHKDNWSYLMVIRGIILSTADLFARANSRFDRETFYRASGLAKDGSLLSD